MTVLVTGAAGFLGSHLADALLDAGHEVIGLDDFSGGFQSNLPAGVRFHKGSILDQEFLDHVFAAQRIDYVYHLAAYAAEGLSHFIRNFNYTNNVVGSVNLINRAIRHEVKCFVFTSSIAVYGASQIPMTEKTVPHPEDPYGIAKRAVELDLEAAHRTFGLNYVIFRPHNIFGERQHIADRYRNVIGIFMSQLMRNEPMTIFGDGEQTRNFTYVHDVTPVMAAAIQRPSAYNRIFNVGSNEVTTVKRLSALVAQAMGAPHRTVHLPERPEVKHAQADHSELLNEFGYNPRWTLQQGLQRMAAWTKAAGCRPPTRLQHIEVEKRLPPTWKEM